MSEEIVHSSHPVTLVGAGEAAEQDLKDALELAPCLVAADGGATFALNAGYTPQAVIGDFDSLTAEDRARVDPGRLHRITEQDSTDFDKALGNIRAPIVLAVGFLGARIDHQLAAFSTLLRFADRPCVLLGPDEIVFLAPPAVSFDVPAGAVVSLFPLCPVAGRSRGLEWPIDGLDLSPGGRIGTSNRATGPVRLNTDAPGLLVIVPRSCLPEVTQALAFRASAPSPWPAPA